MEENARRQREFVERIQNRGNVVLGEPPTGRRVTIRVMDFVRHRDGRVSEHWNIVDVAGLMAQLGAAG